MRSIKRLLASAIVWCLSLSTPAFSGIAQIVGTGPGGAIIAGTFNAGLTVIATNTVNIGIGNLIVIVAENTTTGNPTDINCTDSAGNGTYNAGQPLTIENGASSKILYIYTTAALPIGGTITCVSTGLGGTALFGAAFSGTSATPYDSASATALTGNASAGGPVGPTGTLNGPCGSANCEVLVGEITRHTAGTVTPDANYVNIVGTGSQPYAAGFWIVSATTPRSFATSFTGTANWSGMLQGFKAPAVPVTSHSMFRPIP